MGLSEEIIKEIKDNANYKSRETRWHKEELDAAFTDGLATANAWWVERIRGIKDLFIKI
jgi:hypothetical protein